MEIYDKMYVYVHEHGFYDPESDFFCVSRNFTVK